jgi:uncharacterized protein YbbC (DUF1343 family)
MIHFLHLFLIFIFSMTALDAASIQLGVDSLFSPENASLLKNKRIGIITNHTAVNGELISTINLFKSNASTYGYTIKAFFAPEHGLTGVSHASENIMDSKDRDGFPIYSLHGTTRRPTAAMLKEIDLLIYDIQDIGSRSYTYISTLFYAMEEAAKKSIAVIVLDRPNPINGLTIDGPMLEDEWRSFVGYINVPYCHGMTIGELAQFFNGEYKVGCKLTVIPMKGWKRSMSFADTGLTWIPTSPHIPEAETVFYYPMTGLLGELQMVSTGVGYTLPFKVIGAPWINPIVFANKLNEQKFPGVTFLPFHFRPFFGRFEQQDCQGVLIVVTDPKKYLPVSTQYLLIGILKSLYPQQFSQALKESTSRQQMFNKVNGTAEVYRIIHEEKYPAWRLRQIHLAERQAFIDKRKVYLIADYK